MDTWELNPYPKGEGEGINLRSLDEHETTLEAPLNRKQAPKISNETNIRLSCDYIKWFLDSFHISFINLKSQFYTFHTSYTFIQIQIWNLEWLTYLLEHMKNRVYGFHDELMMEESGHVSEIWVHKPSHIIKACE